MKSPGLIISPGQMRALDGLRLARLQRHQQLQEERQKNDVLLKPDGAIDVTNPEAQEGRKMTREVFMRRITKLNSGLRYERSINYPDQGGIYCVDIRGKRFVCGIPHDWIGEFSVPITKPVLAPVNATDAEWQTIQQVDQHRPGWRKILLKLMQERLLTPAQIDKEFEITKGRSSQKWQQATA